MGILHLHVLGAIVCNIRKQTENLASRNRRGKISLSDYQRISASKEAMSSWKIYGGLLTMTSMGPQSSSCLAEPRKEKEITSSSQTQHLPCKLRVKTLPRKLSPGACKCVCLCFVIVKFYLISFCNSVPWSLSQECKSDTKESTGITVSFFHIKKPLCLTKHVKKHRSSVPTWI